LIIKEVEVGLLMAIRGFPKSTNWCECSDIIEPIYWGTLDL